MVDMNKKRSTPEFALDFQCVSSLFFLLEFLLTLNVAKIHIIFKPYNALSKLKDIRLSESSLKLANRL